MKKNLIAMGAMLTAAFTLTNCTEEIQTAPEVDGEKIPYTIYANAADTKTVNDGFSTKWQGADDSHDADAINVFHTEEGSAYYSENTKFTLVDAETGEFATELLNGELSASNDWFVLYPYDEYITAPDADAGVVIGSEAGLYQTQYGNDSMAHIAGKNYPMWGVAKGVESDALPSLSMSHLSSLIEVEVTNNASQSLTVQSVTVVGTEDLSGLYYVDITADEPLYSSNEENVSDVARLKVSNGAPLAAGASAKFYLAVKPFTALAGETMSLYVNGSRKDLELASDVTFSPGKIKTLKFSYGAENVYVEDGDYWIVADGNVALPLAEDARYGYIPVEPEIDGASYAENAYTFTNVGNGLYTITDSFGRYLYQKDTYTSFNVSYELVEDNSYYWTVISAGDSYHIVNYGLGRYIQYSTRYGSYGSYSTEQGILPVLVPADNPIIPEEPAENVTVLWKGTFESGSWEGGVADLAYGGYNWSDVNAGDTLRLTGFATDPSKDCVVSLRVAPDWSTFLTGVTEYITNATEVEVVFTAAMLDQLTAGEGLIIQGDNYTLKKIELARKIASDDADYTIWKGPFESGSWEGGVTDLTNGGYDWSSAGVGDKLILTGHATDETKDYTVSLRVSDWATFLTGVPQYITNNPKVEVVLTEEIIEHLVTAGGLIVQGDNYTLEKIELIPYSALLDPSGEYTIWEGDEVVSGWENSLENIFGTPDSFKHAGIEVGMEIRIYVTEVGAEWYFQAFDGDWDPQLSFGDKGNQLNHMNTQITNGYFSFTVDQSIYDALTDTQTWGAAVVLQGAGNYHIVKITIK